MTLTEQNLNVDRSLWVTLENLKKLCNSVYLKYLLSDQEMSELALNATLNIEEEQARLENAHKDTETREILNWLKS